jgi:hypothetical protein
MQRLRWVNFEQLHTSDLSHFGEGQNKSLEFRSGKAETVHFFHMASPLNAFAGELSDLHRCRNLNLGRSRRDMAGTGIL